MSTVYLKLAWDSDFFNYNVCRITKQLKSIDDLKEVNSLMEENNIKLAYYSSIEELNFSGIDIQSLEIKLVDHKTTFSKTIDNTLKLHPSISSYNRLPLSPKLLDMAIQSGAYSRFNMDEKIGKNKFEELYRLWLINSVKRELATEVLVYNQGSDIAGFLTIGEKNNRADLGLGAVDSNYRGKGIGRILFQNAEKWCGDEGYTTIQIVTQGDNIPACRLYECLGYSVEKKEYFYHIWKN